jgi:hypothetical protein
MVPRALTVGLPPEETPAGQNELILRPARY